MGIGSFFSGKSDNDGGLGSFISVVVNEASSDEQFRKLSGFPNLAALAKSPDGGQAIAGVITSLVNNAPEERSTSSSCCKRDVSLFLEREFSVARGVWEHLYPSMRQTIFNNFSESFKVTAQNTLSL